MQIRGAMLSICCKEGVSIRPEALDEIIIGANQDVRQVLHHLSLLSSKEKTMSTEQAKIDAQRSKKDFKLGPWDVCRKVSCNSQFIYSVLIGETFILPISSELDLDRSSKWKIFELHEISFFLENIWIPESSRLFFLLFPPS